jgi:chemotaxis protein CheD
VTGIEAVAVQRQAYYLHPGQLLVTRVPTAVTTILGSCVSVCLFDRAKAIGGINHFMLPNWVGRGRASARFGNLAVDSLIEGMCHEGSALRDLKAKIFGGSHLFGTGVEVKADSLSAALGLRNIEVARAMLEALRIEILGEDVGGRLGRKLIFHTDDGSIQVKELRRTEDT